MTTHEHGYVRGTLSVAETFEGGVAVEAEGTVVELEDIQRIDVAFEGERVSMQREGDAWIDVDDPAFPLDAFQVSAGFRSAFAMSS